MLKTQRARTATPMPTAVVTRASEMPPATAPMPPEPVSCMPRNALMMPKIVPNSPMKGADVAIVARMRQAAPELLVEQDLGALAAAGRRLDLLVEAELGFLAFDDVLDAGRR